MRRIRNVVCPSDRPVQLNDHLFSFPPPFMMSHLAYIDTSNNNNVVLPKPSAKSIVEVLHKFQTVRQLAMEGLDDRAFP
jgi:hypothetical protein